jgi:hypothetical protein
LEDRRALDLIVECLALNSYIASAFFNIIEIVDIAKIERTTGTDLEEQMD